MVIEPAETARRVRAARAYAGLTREELAERGPLTYKQLKLVEDGRRRITTRDELFGLGRACGVPDEFMEIGFQGAQDVYGQLQEIFAVVLSQNLPAILALGDRLNVAPDRLTDERDGAGPAGLPPSAQRVDGESARAAQG